MQRADQPGDDEQRTWHVHPMDQSWDWGVVCEKCAATRPDGAPYGPMFNIKRLKSDNAGHYTQRELAREVTDAAREDGRDIHLSR